MTLAAGCSYVCVAVNGLAFVFTPDQRTDPKVPEIAVYSKLQGIHWQGGVADDLRGLLHPAPVLYK